MAAHTLKGSANAVGAGRVAILADAAEIALGPDGSVGAPSDLLAALALAIDEATRAISAHLAAG